MRSPARGENLESLSRSGLPAGQRLETSTGELARHARGSLGSSSELSYYLILAHDLSYMTGPERDDLQGSLSEVRRMLASLERVWASAAERAAPWPRLRRKSPPPGDAVSADG